MIGPYCINSKLGRRCFTPSIENSNKSFGRRTICRKKSTSSSIIKTILSKTSEISISNSERSEGEEARTKEGKNVTVEADAFIPPPSDGVGSDTEEAADGGAEASCDEGARPALKGDGRI
jgi:hypothetical protein